MFEVTQRMQDFTLQVYTRMGIAIPASFEANRQSRVISKRAGDPIWRYGETITHWSYIVDGIVAELVNLGPGSGYPLSLHGRNSSFARQELSGDGRACVDYVAVTDVELLTLPADVYRALLDADPGFARHLVGMLSRQMQQQTKLLIVNKCSNSALRVVGGLALCAEGFGEQRQPMAVHGGDRHNRLLLPLSQQMIARLCGVSRTLFSEYVGQLAQGNWAQLQYRGVELLQLPVWQRVFAHLHRQQVWRSNPSIGQLMCILDECAADQEVLCG